MSSDVDDEVLIGMGIEFVRVQEGRFEILVTCKFFPSLTSLPVIASEAR